LATVEAWPILWAPSGRRGGMARPLGPVSPPLGHGLYRWPHLATVGCGLSPWPPLADVGAGPVPWTPSGCREGVVGPLEPIS